VAGAAAVATSYEEVDGTENVGCTNAWRFGEIPLPTADVDWPSWGPRSTAMD
jgi:hypothetical protein